MYKKIKEKLMKIVKNFVAKIRDTIKDCLTLASGKCNTNYHYQIAFSYFLLYLDFWYK